MIAIIDYGMGNLRSVFNACTYLGFESRITDDGDETLKADKIVLPGVGSFRVAMENIRLKRLDETLKRVIDRGTPILGICLGMQLLADWGEEDGLTKGLGWIPGCVQKLHASRDHKIPHIGFNKAIFKSSGDGSLSIFNGLGSAADFYFVHSYRMSCDDVSHISAETKYGETFTSAVKRDHVYGVQFHVEKSRRNGLKVLQNFCSL